MHLTLHLTPACNMRCSYCYTPPHEGLAMTSDVAQAALRLGARLHTGSCGVVFFGGEPLLQKDLIAGIVDQARQMEQDGAARFHFKITTNGLLLDDDWLAFAVRNDILVAFSFDGVQPAQDRHRRLPDGRGTFDVLLPRLKALLAVRPYASVLTVVSPQTAGYLAESVEFLVDLGVRYLILSLNYAGEWSEETLRVLRRQLERLARDYVTWTRAGRKFYLSPFEVKLSSHINRHCYQKERCELGERQLSVDPQGYLYPCVQFPKAGPDSEWCIGHVSTGVDEARRQAIRARSQADKAFCEPCAIKDRCHNTCGCLNWQTTGEINRISPVLCRYEQMMVPLADRVGERLYRRRDPLFLHKHYNAAYPVLSLLEDRLKKR